MRFSTALVFVAFACMLALARARPTTPSSLLGRAYTRRAPDSDPRMAVVLGGRLGRAARLQARSLRGVAEGGADDERGKGSRQADLAAHGVFLSHQQPAPSVPSPSAATTSSTTTPATPVPVAVPAPIPTPPAHAKEAKHHRAKTTPSAHRNSKVHHVTAE
ncbi:hypothetical protein FB451DRAFT_629588 [Mycena latifolia]|nr:hypothetical protein FB451DRAFT_629588 [Mycena latifolia]